MTTRDLPPTRRTLRKLQMLPGVGRAKDGLRAVRRAIPTAWRRATQGQRALPALIIAGAQKAGTTQLHTYLSKHPRCYSGVRKEVNYFSHHFDRSQAWYRSQFPLKRALSVVDGICLDSSPMYLPSAKAIRRMHEILPAVKVIVLLRDPIERTYSHYQHLKSRWREQRTFSEAIDEALALLPNVLEPTETVCAFHGTPVEYVSWSYYAHQLRVILDVYPREQLMVIDSADLFDDTNEVCQRVFDLLGLERLDVSPRKIHNRGNHAEQIDPGVADRLRQHFRPYDRMLVDLLGQSFRWMKAEVVSSQSAA